MATAQQTSAGGGIFSKLIVVALLALTIALYLRIVMVDTGSQADEPPVAQASVRVLEGDEPAPASQSMEILPQDQMEVIMQVFAPELLDQ